MSAELPSRPYVPRGAPATAARDARFVLNPPYVHGRVVIGASAPHVEAELPSIDEFLDHVPPIEKFAPAAGGGEREEPTGSDWPSWGGEAVPFGSPAADAWGSSDWQGYDWDGAARLGAAPPDAAAEAWASTDWSEPKESQRVRRSAAEALAQALDQIARRIRAGELRVPGPETVQDDAAIAATLAALLGIKR